MFCSWLSYACTRENVHPVMGVLSWYTEFEWLRTQVNKDEVCFWYLLTDNMEPMNLKSIIKRCCFDHPWPVYFCPHFQTWLQRSRKLTLLRHCRRLVWICCKSVIKPCLWLILRACCRIGTEYLYLSHTSSSASLGCIPLVPLGQQTCYRLGGYESHDGYCSLDLLNCWW